MKQNILIKLDLRVQHRLVDLFFPPILSIPRGFWFWGTGKRQHKDPSFWAWEAKVFQMDLAWPNNLGVDGLCTHRWVSVLAVMTLLTNDRRPSAWSPANPITNSHVESLKIGIYEVPGIMCESICPLPWTMAEARREGCKRSASLILDSVRLLFHKCLLVRHWSQCWLHRLGCHGDERVKIKW